MPAVRSIWLRTLPVIGLALIAAFSLAGSAQAVEYVEGSTIPEGTVIDDDVFISGERVTVDGTVNGILFAAGSEVTINGRVDGNLFAAGQNVTINGEVTGSVFTGAAGITLGSSAEVGRNMFVGGYGLEARPGSIIGRDLLVGGYQAVLAGEVERDVRVAGAALEISGVVGGDVNADVGESMGGADFPTFFPGPPGAPASIAPGLRISDDAEIGGSLIYTSPVEQGQNIEIAPEGGIVFQTPVVVPQEEAPEPSPTVRIVTNVGGWILARLRLFITLLVLGALVIWLLPDRLNQVVDMVRSQPLASAGWGFVAIIVGYLGAALLAVLILGLGLLVGLLTLGGLDETVFGVGFTSLGLAFTIFALLVGYGSKLVVAFLGGRWLLETIFPDSKIHRIWPLLLGVIIYVILRAIPLLGWIIGVGVTLVGVGAMWLVLRELRAPSALEAA